MTVFLKKTLPTLLLSMSCIFGTPAIADAPMDDVFSLLKNNGGTLSGSNIADGYYIVSMGFSDRSNLNKAHEEARMNALRSLTEIINGVKISGSTVASMKDVSVSGNDENSEFSSESFIETVKTSFTGHLSAAKVLKSGQHKGKHFVAIVITQSDIQNTSRLKTPSAANSALNIVNGEQKKSVASFEIKERIVEAKGLASMKHGEAKARELAMVDAFRNAIQQTQGVMLQGKSGKYNEAISLAISTKTQGYVSHFEILDEDIERGQYYMIIDATVNAGKLLNDVNFYTQIFGQPVFSIDSNNAEKSDWLMDELEQLGFRINNGTTKPSHTFHLSQTNRLVEDHKGSKGAETALSLKLRDKITGDVLFTINNSPQKTRIFVQPSSRAKQVSEHIAYKQMNKTMRIELIQALAKNAERGTVYQIVLKNAKRNDVEIFKHVLNNGSSGNVENWSWDKTSKTMTLHFRFSGPLSEAMDQSLNELYSSFKKTGKGRRPHMIQVGSHAANFDILG